MQESAQRFHTPLVTENITKELKRERKKGIFNPPPPQEWGKRRKNSPTTGVGAI